MNQCQKQGFHYCPNCDNQIVDPRILEQRLQLLEAEHDAARSYLQDKLTKYAWAKLVAAVDAKQP